jgi:hypothetical protein
MPVKIQPTSVIKARLGLEPNGRVQKFFTETCYKHMDKYVPMDKGDLRTRVDVQADRIIYESPYAHYQYVGKVYVMPNGKAGYYAPDYGWWSDKGVAKHKTNKKLTYKTPGTGKHWDKRMKSAEMKDIVKEVQTYVNRGGK